MFFFSILLAWIIDSQLINDARLRYLFSLLKISPKIHERVSRNTGAKIEMDNRSKGDQGQLAKRISWLIDYFCYILTGNRASVDIKIILDVSEDSAPLGSVIC